MDKKSLKSFLDEKVEQYNQPRFIESDPISIPHQFSKKQDIEIASLLTATIAWGRREAIIKSANQLMEWLDNDPHQFITNASPKELSKFSGFVYRTFNGIDCTYFIQALKECYKQCDSLESAFIKNTKPDGTTLPYVMAFRKIFLGFEFLPQRTTKHVSNPAKGSSTKRLNMLLRWLVRNDNSGVDFGIWNSISPSELICPLDVHSGNVARKLGLLTRKQNDWKAAIELTYNLKQFDSKDPVKYDFALFGLGVFEGF